MALVTGAGRGIGRAYAHLLAQRGASVVVNDLGAGVDGSGADSAPAATVTDEISRAGGIAVADAHDISTSEGADAAVAGALERFGRLDILIANAGIMRWAEITDVTDDDFDRHWAVHVKGSFATARAAWPHMVGAGYGRIVMTTSTGMLGLANNVAYATAKGAVIGLARSLATAGARHGITVNLIAPAAVTRMAPGATDDPAMAPELVAPMVAFLAHERCPVTGRIYTGGAGRFARLFIGSTDGYVHAGPTPTVEDIARHWDAIDDTTDHLEPADLMAWSDQFTRHLRGDDNESRDP